MTQQRDARDPGWDNLRFAAGALVVVMHAADPILADRDGLRWLHIATWALRVPLFAVLAGYFSSAAPLTRRRGGLLVESLVVPYVALQALSALEIWAMSGYAWPDEVKARTWTMWFLVSLLVWRLALPYLARLRHPLSASVVAAVLAGYLPLTEIALFEFSRNVCFLPFFLLGWRLREGGLDELRSRLSRRAAWTVLGVTFAAAWPLTRLLDVEWLKMRAPYAQAAGEQLAASHAWAVRGAILLGGMLVVLSAIRLVPRRRLPFVTCLGAGGLYIYLLHPLALRPLNAADVPARFDSWPDQGALVLATMLLAAALASPPVRRLTRPLVQPRLLRERVLASASPPKRSSAFS